jgi:glycosyltransferase involved in cell wall biosynthesis
MRVDIVTPTHPGGPHLLGKQLAETLRSKGIQSIWTHQLAGVLLSSFYPPADITHSLTVPMFPVVKAVKGPLLLSLHGDHTRENTPWAKILPLAIRRADAITTPCHYLRDRLGLASAIIIPNGVFPERFKVVTHCDKKIINLVTMTQFGFLEKASGILDILQVLHAVGDSQIRYKVVGGGFYLGRIKEEAKKYSVEVEFTGFLPDPRQALETSDIFLYYSRLDIFPTVILEAMASGLPVITCNVGATSEMIQHGVDGFVAETEDSYLDALRSLLKDAGMRRRIGTNARSSVERRFSWHTLVDDYVALYKKLL